jgi:hypothetical protein
MYAKRNSLTDMHSGSSQPAESIDKKTTLAVFIRNLLTNLLRHGAGKALNMQQDRNRAVA